VRGSRALGVSEAAFTTVALLTDSLPAAQDDCQQGAEEGEKANQRLNALDLKTIYYAVVEANGNLARGTQGTSSSQVGTGLYQVNFPQNISQCAWVTSIGGSAGGPGSAGRDSLLPGTREHDQPAAADLELGRCPGGPAIPCDRHLRVADQVHGEARPSRRAFSFPFGVHFGST
jgi:hypothetical protein